MKKILCLAAGLLALNLTPGFGQPAPTPPEPIHSPQFTRQRLPIYPVSVPGAGLPANQNELTKFNLDFPGGTPAQLVAAIEKAMGKPLNVIISEKDAAEKLPFLKLNNVNVSELFTALQSASVKKESLVQHNGLPIGYAFTASYMQIETDYGFKTDGPVTDDSIWYFHVEKPALPPVIPVPKFSKFYSLTPYLENGLTVDDITTAIQAGWKMSGQTSLPELNYHKETKLLMAYGEMEKLQTIDDVLKTLPKFDENASFMRTMRLNLPLAESGETNKRISTPATNNASAPEEKSGK